MGGLFQLLLGKGGNTQELANAHSLVFWQCLRTVIAPLGVSFRLLIEYQGLIKVDLSAILDPFDSNWFMLCPWAMSFFQKLCPAPFSPVIEGQKTICLRDNPAREISKKWDKSCGKWPTALSTHTVECVWLPVPPKCLCSLHTKI